MGQLGDIIRATHKHSYLGQECINVFFYQISNLSGGTGVCTDFGNEYLANYETIVLPSFVDALELKQIYLENLTDGIDIDIRSSTATGGRVGNPLPSFVAMGVKLPRATKVTRNGSKRFVGLEESQVVDNSLTMTAPLQSAVANYCANNQQYLDYDGQGNNITLKPVIIGRTKNVNGVYELDLSKVNDILLPQVNPLVTTQNSRKV